MDIIKTSIQDLYIIQPQVFGDSRDGLLKAGQKSI